MHTNTHAVTWAHNNKQLSAIILTKSITRTGEWRRVCVTALPQDQSLSNSRSWQETRSLMGTHLECKNVECESVCVCIYIYLSGCCLCRLALQGGGAWPRSRHRVWYQGRTDPLFLFRAPHTEKKSTDFHSASVTLKCLEMFIHNKQAE